MKKNSLSLIIIVVLLILSLAGVLYGTYIRYFTDYQKQVNDPNPNKEFKLNNTLYFYQNDVLLGTYKCNNTYCDYPNNLIDELDKNMNDYQELNIVKENFLANNKYAFISDNQNETDTSASLYNIADNFSIVKYNGIKLYNNRLFNNKYIVKGNNNLYGVVTIGVNPSVSIEIEYDYIGIKQILNENNELLSDKFIVKKDNKFYLIDENKNELTSKYDYQIIDYNDKYVILKNEDNNMIYNYEGIRLLEGYNAKSLKFIDKYVEVRTSNDIYFIYDLENSRMISTPKNVKDIKSIITKIEENNLIITMDGEEVESIPLT